MLFCGMPEITISGNFGAGFGTFIHKRVMFLHARIALFGHFLRLFRITKFKLTPTRLPRRSWGAPGLLLGRPRGSRGLAGRPR